MGLPPIPAHRSIGPRFASNLKKATIDLKNDIRGEPEAGGKAFTAEEKVAFSFDAIVNGGTCETCS